MVCLNRIEARVLVLLTLLVLAGGPALAGVTEVTVGPQVRIDAGGGGGSNETTIAAVQGNPQVAVAGWNDSRSGGNNGIGLTTDGGATWDDAIFPPPPGASMGWGGDPMACYDNRTGTLWFGGMSWNNDGGVFAARMDSGQSSFGETVMIYGGFVDKGWMAAGRGPSSPDSTYVYCAYNRGCQRSTDMGDTWNNAVSLGSEIGYLPRVGPNGELYVASWDFGDGVMLRRSFNGGSSFEPAIRIATRMDFWDTQSGNRFPGVFRVPALHYLAVDPNSGKLYCLFSDTTGWSGGNRNVDIYLTHSTDQGSTWSTPHVINSDADPAGDQFWSWLEVDPQGRLHTCWLDSRHTVQDDETFHGMFDAYYAISEDGGNTWTEYRLTPASFDSYYAGGSYQFLGDYMGLALAGNRVYPCYPSTQNGHSDVFTNVITISGGGGGLRLVAGPGPGPDNPPLVRVFPPEEDATHLAEFTAYGATGYGVNVTAGDLNGDGLDELLTGAGPGAVYGPHVRGFTAFGTALPGLSFFAYGTHKWGVNVAAGDLDGDGRDEILTGAGPGAVFGPHVRAFSWDGVSSVSPLSDVSYFAYGTLKWGVNVAAGDIDGDGRDEIVTGAGPGAIFGPHVRGWNVDGGTAGPMSTVSFLAYGTNKFGVNVTCGDVDGDGVDEIITAPGPSGLFSAHLRGWNYDGSSLEALPGLSFFAWGTGEALYGARVSAKADFDDDGRDELVVGGGPDPAIGSPVAVFRYDGASVSRWFGLTAFDSGVTRGATVAAGEF